MFPSRADRKATVTATIRNAQGSKLVVHARGLQNREPGFESRLPCLKSHTVNRTFRTEQRREFVRVTEGQLDLGPWQQIFYCEFDGQRSKRLVIKVMGE